MHHGAPGTSAVFTWCTHLHGAHIHMVLPARPSPSHPAGLLECSYATLGVRASCCLPGAVRGAETAAPRKHSQQQGLVHSRVGEAVSGGALLGRARRAQGPVAAGRPRRLCNTLLLWICSLNNPRGPRAAGGVSAGRACSCCCCFSYCSRQDGCWVGPARRRQRLRLACCPATLARRLQPPDLLHAQGACCIYPGRRMLPTGCTLGGHGVLLAGIPAARAILMLQPRLATVEGSARALLHSHRRTEDKGVDEQGLRSKGGGACRLHAVVAHARTHVAGWSAPGTMNARCRPRKVCALCAREGGSAALRSSALAVLQSKAYGVHCGQSTGLRQQSSHAW